MLALIFFPLTVCTTLFNIGCGNIKTAALTGFVAGLWMYDFLKALGAP